MKKIKVLSALALIAVALPAFAAMEKVGQVEVNKINDGEQKGIHEPGTGIVNPELKAENNENVDVTNQIVGLGLEKGLNATSSERRSRVANSVMEMLQVADRNGGIGQQIREVAQNQQMEMTQTEEVLNDIRNRGQFKKFLFGPDYKKVGDAEALLVRHEERLTQLKQLQVQITNEIDKTMLELRIMEMEQVKLEMQKEVTDSEKGFSLFGWLNKMIFKK